jgi:hypothetical protein
MMAAATLALLREHGAVRVGITVRCGSVPADGAGVWRMVGVGDAQPTRSVPITAISNITVEVQALFGGDASCASSISTPTTFLAPPAAPLASPTSSILTCASAKALYSRSLCFLLADSVKKISDRIGIGTLWTLERLPLVGLCWYFVLLAQH